jgi:hypothetical protein
MVANRIPEISPADTGDIWSRYVLARKPVVIRGLFADQPIAQAATLAAARRLLGTMPVVVKDEYTKQLTEESGGGDHAQITSLARYVDEFGSGSTGGRVVAEYDVPPALIDLFSLPDWCLPSAPTHDVYLHSFLAGPGDFAHAHFDMDQRHVLLAQVFGTKRVVVFPPSASRWMHPFGNLGSVCIEAMSDGERESFLDCAGGAEAVIGPTDAVYMPLLVWHYTSYLDLGLSFNIRFGRNSYSRFFSVENFIGDQFVQGVAEPFGSIPPGGRPAGELAATLQEVVDVFNRDDYPTRLDKYRAVHQTFRDIYLRTAQSGPLHLFPLEERTEQRALSAMSNTLLYRPGAKASTAPNVPVRASRSQLVDLQRKLDQAGYGPARTEKVIANMFGRALLGDLSRDEVNRFIAYLASPSGAVAIGD